MTVAETMGFEHQQFVDIAPDIEAVVIEAERAFDRGEDIGFRVERSKTVLLPNGVLEIKQLSDVFRTMEEHMIKGPAPIPSVADALSNEWFDNKFSAGDADLDILFYSFAYDESQRRGGDFNLGKDMKPTPFFDPRNETEYGADTPDLAERQEELLTWLRGLLADDSRVTMVTWFSKLGRLIDDARMLPPLGDVTRVEVLRPGSDEPEEPTEYYSVLIRKLDEFDAYSHIGIDPFRQEAYQQVDIDQEPAVHVVPSPGLLRQVAKWIKESANQ